MSVISRLWDLYQKDADASDDELGTFEEYGLGWSYVPADTFSDQKQGYIRWQLSWGGPADEFRFFLDELLRPIRIEYWYLDWFDGACVDCTDEPVIRSIFDFVSEPALLIRAELEDE